MSEMRTVLRGVAAVAFTILVAFVASSSAADILDDWSTVKAPPPIELKAVTLDGSTTALLILDMMKMNCGARPRCVATVPNVKKLHDAARAAGAMVWYSFVGSNGMATPADQIDPGFTAHDGEVGASERPGQIHWLESGREAKGAGHQDGHRLRHLVSRRGNRHGRRSAQRGYKVIIPIDCLSSEDTYMEQYSAFHLFKGAPAGVTSQVTMTRTTMIKF